MYSSAVQYERFARQQALLWKLTGTLPSARPKPVSYSITRAVQATQNLLLKHSQHPKRDVVEPFQDRWALRNSIALPYSRVPPPNLLGTDLQPLWDYASVFSALVSAFEPGAWLGSLASVQCN